MQQDTTIPQHNNYEYQPSEPPRSGSNKGESTWRSILSTIGIIVAAPLIALLLINFVFQSYEVDGPSMEDTLQNGDRLIVLKVGKTMADLRNQPYIPERGTIIIFHKTDSTEFGGTTDRQLVKRVIGLPGERVLVREGRITIYNKQHPNGFDPDKDTDYEVNIPEATMGNVDLTVPEDELFVIGDNRVNSLDSRMFGTVPAEQVVGELSLRIYPFSKFETF